MPGAPGLEYAGALPRFVAYLIDAILLGVISLLISGFVISAAPDSAAAVFSGGLLSAAIDAAYFTLLWTSEGRATIGMRLLKLQVGNATDGRVITPSQAVRRWLAFGTWLPIVALTPQLTGLTELAVAVWLIVLLLTISMSPTKQGLHDRFAETAVVQPVGGAGNPLVLGCLAIAIVLVGAMVLSIVALILLGSEVSTILSNVGTSI